LNTRYISSREMPPFSCIWMKMDGTGQDDVST
jgi:hypothetical protein